MFDPEKFGEAMGEAIRAAVAPLTRRIGDLEAQLAKAVDVPAEVERAVAAAVAALPVPRDGKDAVPIDKDAVVKEVLAQIPTPSNGKDGADGKSLSVDDVRPLLDDAVKAMQASAQTMLHDAIKAIPTPKDGAAGKDGANGKDGEPGERGADGLGLAGAMIDRDGSLQITMTNGEVKSLGKVVGKDGADGVDGVSFETFEMEYLPESHEISVKAAVIGRTKELRYPAGGIRPAGYWREGTRAKSGEAWVNDGSLWIAVKDCQSKPGLNDEAWIIAARKGKDGERGQKGADAGPAAPIKLG
jgi:hypothetical protein